MFSSLQLQPVVTPDIKESLRKMPDLPPCSHKHSSSSTIACTNTSSPTRRETNSNKNLMTGKQFCTAAATDVVHALDKINRAHQCRGIMQGACDEVSEAERRARKPLWTAALPHHNRPELP
ncbi:hypothetical protein FB45DRAFT_1033888 [Roridomyces roridus]|uniref:Uncharacterized protein n=1 Tax=Roridomyces roridus TaxID=1738132 RepID=A0AAD7FGD7_9AGAR|nr:hypothetical protein FB45DRAFT_1033888 [Roridomyces roridus]